MKMILPVHIIRTLLSGIALMTALSVPAMAADNPTEVTLFKNVNVFDGKSEKLLMGYDVLVVKNLIKKVAKDIPTSGTYGLDVKTGGLKPMEAPPTAEFGHANVVMIYEQEQAVKKEIKVNVIDGGGRTRMPGMIEAHGHVTYASPLPGIVLGQDSNEQAIRTAPRANDHLEVPGARTTLPVSRRCFRRERQYLIAALTQGNGQDANEGAGRESETMA